MQSRYYDPAVKRFISADGYINANGDLLGFNMYAYCSNNPVNFCDKSGLAVETLFDIISLGESITQVAINPYDPWAWIGLVGDTADVLIPFVGGIGETTKAFKTIASYRFNAVTCSNVFKQFASVLTDGSLMTFLVIRCF